MGIALDRPRAGQAARAEPGRTPKVPEPLTPCSDATLAGAGGLSEHNAGLPSRPQKQARAPAERSRTPPNATVRAAIRSRCACGFARGAVAALGACGGAERASPAEGPPRRANASRANTEARAALGRIFL